MSTRGQIRVAGLKASIYKHWDSYPAGVLPTLLPFVERFWKARGFDCEYFLFRCAAEFLREEAEQLKEDHSDPKDQVLGLGIADSIHGDIEFLYTVEKDGTVRVDVPVFGPEGFDPVSFRNIGKFPLGTTDEAALKALGMKRLSDQSSATPVKPLVDAGIV